MPKESQHTGLFRCCIRASVPLLGLTLRGLDKPLEKVREGNQKAAAQTPQKANDTSYDRLGKAHNQAPHRNTVKQKSAERSCVGVPSRYPVMELESQQDHNDGSEKTKEKILHKAKTDVDARNMLSEKPPEPSRRRDLGPRKTKCRPSDPKKVIHGTQKEARQKRKQQNGQKEAP